MGYEVKLTSAAEDDAYAAFVAESDGRTGGPLMADTQKETWMGREWPPDRLPEFRLVMEPVDDEARQMEPFKWAGDDIGKRHKIGGEPHEIQSIPAEVRTCAECGEPMVFYSQFDSLNDFYIIGDCGMIYVFYCFRCFEAKAYVAGY